MATKEPSSSPHRGRHGSLSEEEWNRHKKAFYECYVVENTPLKKAVEYMKNNHGLDATARQWERRINIWGFHKYEPKEVREKIIRDSGKSLEELAASHETPSLSPSRVSQRRGRSPGHNSQNRNFKRYIQRQQRNRSRVPTPVPEDRSPLDKGPEDQLSLSDGDPFSQSDAYVNDTTYDLTLPDVSLQAQDPMHPLDHFNLEAHLAQPNTHHAVQLHLLTDASPEAAHSVPELWVSMHNDDQQDEEWARVPPNYNADLDMMPVPPPTQPHPGSNNVQLGQTVGAFDIISAFPILTDAHQPMPALDMQYGDTPMDSWSGNMNSTYSDPNVSAIQPQINIIQQSPPLSNDYFSQLTFQNDVNSMSQLQQQQRQQQQLQQQQYNASLANEPSQRFQDQQQQSTALTSSSSFVLPDSVQRPGQDSALQADVFGFVKNYVNQVQMAAKNFAVAKVNEATARAASPYGMHASASNAERTFDGDLELMSMI